MVNLAYGSERHVEVLSEKQIERVLLYIKDADKVNKQKIINWIKMNK